MEAGSRSEIAIGGSRVVLRGLSGGGGGGGGGRLPSGGGGGRSAIVGELSLEVGRQGRLCACVCTLATRRPCENVQELFWSFSCLLIIFFSTTLPPSKTSARRV